jgi:DNA-binding response OmpR family regulator
MAASGWLTSGRPGGAAAGTAARAVAVRPPVAGAPSAAALIVHDDVQMIATIEFALETQGFRVRVATSATCALTMMDADRPDIVVTDTSASAIDVAALHREIRRTWRIPVIVMIDGADGAPASEGVIEAAVDFPGATVSITKPFHPRDLAERAAALSRRNTPPAEDVVHVGRLRIDQIRLTVTVGGERLDLPFTEFKLLTHLALHRGTPQTWRTLLHTVWEAQTLAGGSDVVKSAIYRLRSRLADAGGADDHVLTLRGAGYMMPDLPPEPC